LLVDRAAAEITAKLDYDFSTISTHISVVSQLAWIARSLHIDRTIRDFLSYHPEATIVNIGCGLDTTFERVDNGTLTWFDIDLPDVIELRSGLISEGSRQRSIASSALDEPWLEQIQPRRGVLFVAAGVLYYFEERQVRDLLVRLSRAFPESEAVFDACSPFGARVANKKVIKDAGMDESACLKWGLDRARNLEAWDDRIRVVESYRLFRDVTGRLPWKEKVATRFSDILRVMFMVHLKLRG
jgi:O-methyltransferase involved in polyketide biosynthesis